jgi:hypothetical protein
VYVEIKTTEKMVKYRELNLRERLLDFNQSLIQ